MTSDSPVDYRIEVREAQPASYWPGSRDAVKWDVDVELLADGATIDSGTVAVHLSETGQAVVAARAPAYVREHVEMRARALPNDAELLTRLIEGGPHPLGAPPS